MGDHDTAIAGFYDHQEHEQSRTPDWGGDDLFTSAAPRRRRFERVVHPARPRDLGEHRSAPTDHADAHRPSGGPLADASALVAPALSDRYLQPVPAGRRTVTITGRPESVAVARRRPRTLDEHIAHRPERIASWTCAMGVLLILLAVLTSH